MELQNGRPAGADRRQPREARVYDYLDGLGIEYQRVDHAPAQTMEDCKAIDEVIYKDFEGCPLPVPKRYDEYLTFLYGDYMELAPLSTRLGCHEILLCDIGKYDNLT